MTEQLSLLSEPRARHDDLSTSRDAAAKVTPSSGERKQRILVAFAACGPMTDDELAVLFPESHPPTIKSARSQLTNTGQLSATGEKRLSARGAAMTVWRLS